MKQGVRSAIAGVLLGAVLLTATACGNNDNGSNAQPQPTTATAGSSASADSGGTETAVKKGGSFSASVYDRGLVPASEGTYEDNRWTRRMNEQSGVNVKWVPIPRGQEQDKFNVLVASGQAPDLITSYDRNMLSRFVSQGVAQPIDSYIEKYSTVYKQYLEEHPELKPYVTFDGQTYAVASLRNTRALTTIWIRQDWLDKLKLNTPTTVDELLEVARAFRDGDPDGNGVDDTIPISVGSAHSAVLEDLFMARGGEWYVEDGRATLSFFTDRFKSSVDFRKTLYDEKLIDSEYITDTNGARQTQLWNTGQSGIRFDIYTAGVSLEFFQNQPDARITALSPLATKYGRNGYQQEVPNFLLTLFNKDMKDPAAAMQFIDWQIGEGWYGLTYGDEGVHYELKNNVPVTKDAQKYMDEVRWAYEYRLVMQEELTPDSLLAQASDDPLDQKVKQAQAQALRESAEVAYRKDFPYTPPVTEFTDIYGQLQKKWFEVIDKATMTKELTSDWAVEQIRAEWNNLGGAAIEQKVQAWYEQNKDLLQ